MSVAGLVVAAGADVSSVSPAYQLTRQGTNAMLAGNAERAREMFNRAVDQLFDFPAAHLGIGHLAMADGRYQEALESYLAALRGFERLGDWLLEVERERYADARTIILRLEREIEAEQRKLDKQLARDRISEEQVARFEARIRAYRAQIDQLRAVERPVPAQEASYEGAPGEAYFHLGNVMFRQQKYLDAAEAWQACAERSPEFGLARYNLALVYLKLGRIEEARANLAEAERLGQDVHPQVKARLSES